MAARADSVLALDSVGGGRRARRSRTRRRTGSANVEVREANVFDELRELEIERARIRHDRARSARLRARTRPRSSAPSAGYKEINLRAMQLLAPGGHLVTCSCSYNVDEALFLEVLRDAAIDARRTMTLVEKRMQARDHPVLLAVPETYYLKCMVLRRAD